MELKVIYLLLALQKVLCEKHGTNAQKRTAFISDTHTMSVEDLKNNYSDNVFKTEMAKLESGIEMYKHKIKNQQNKHKKLEKIILQHMPEKCKKNNCPLEEKPVCAKFFYKKSNRKPFYVRLVNECEMSYMKCHGGLASTIVSMDKCHSTIDNVQLSEHTENKRSKRSLKGPPAKTIVKPNKLNPKAMPKAKILLSNKKINLKALNNVNTTKLNQKITIKPNKINPESTSHLNLISSSQKAAPRVSGKKIDLKSGKAKLESRNLKILSINKTLAARNKVILKNTDKVIPAHNTINNNSHIPANKTNLQSLAAKNLKNSNKIKLKTINATNVTIKPTNHTKIKLKSKSSNKTNSGYVSKVKTAPKTVSKALLKGSGKTIVGQHAPKTFGGVKSGKKPSVRKPKLRQREHGSIENLNGKEYLEKNVGKDKMFTHEVFSNAKSQYLDQETDADQNSGVIGMDDDVFEVGPQASQDDSPIEINETENENPNENIDVEIELDDADVEEAFMDKNDDTILSGSINMADSEEQDNGPNIEGTIEIDDKDLSNIGFGFSENNMLSEEINKDLTETDLNVYDEKNNQNTDEYQDKTYSIENENNSEQDPTELNEHAPLIKLPRVVGEFDNFNNEEDEYHYEPGAIPPIIALDVDEKEKREDIQEDAGGDNSDTNTHIDTDVNDGNFGDSDEENINNDSIAGDRPSGDNTDPTSVNRPFPKPVENGGEVYKEEYDAECPRLCPARDLMVCAVCQHGIYRTFLSVCHMRMYQCQSKVKEELGLVSRLPCVMSAPLITEDPEMQPDGRLSEPGDHDIVLRYVRCRDKGILGKSPKCTFEDAETLNQEVTRDPEY